MKKLPSFLHLTLFLGELGGFFFLLFLSLSLPAQTITNFAGVGVTGPTGSYSGDSGPATAAGLNRPWGIAADSAGNIYITDGGATLVRKVAVTGVITTIAGNGTYSYSGDGGPATAARSMPYSVCADNRGNIYITDSGSRVRKINATGIINVFAGNGTAGYGGDGGPATLALLDNPRGIAADNAGNIYIGEQHGYRVRKVDAAGIITTVAGNGISGYLGDGGPATDARLGQVIDVAVDRSGNLYICGLDNYIRKVSAAGIITTFAGTGAFGYGGDGGPATAAVFNNARGVTTDSMGNVYISDHNARIRKIDMSGIITTYGGNGTPGYSGDGGPATSAKILGPSGIAVARNGNVYFSDNYNNCARMIYYNHAPYFTRGYAVDTVNITVCLDSSISLDSPLAVVDIDPRQREVWSLISGPTHGTAVVAYADTSTGYMLIPAGLSYTPTTGYIGSDIFYVRITDGSVSDTVAVKVSIVDCHHLGVTTAARQNNNGIDIYPIPNDGAFTLSSTLGS